MRSFFHRRPNTAAALVIAAIIVALVALPLLFFVWLGAAGCC